MISAAQCKAAIFGVTIFVCAAACPPRAIAQDDTAPHAASASQTSKKSNTAANAAARAASAEASKILHDAVKAAGGANALSKIRSVVIEGSVTPVNGAASGSFTFDAKLPNRYYMEIVAGDRSFIDSFNGKSAWHQNAAGELNTLVGPDAMQFELAARWANAHLAAIKRYKLAAAYVGTANVRGKDAVEIEVMDAVAGTSGAKRQIYFDAATHLTLEESATIGGLPQQIFFNDYHAINGVQLPYSIELVRGGATYTVQVTRAAINESVGERVFDFPHKSQVVLPDLKQLFAEVHQRELVNEKRRQKYEGKKIETETDVDKKGNATETTVTESAFFYLYGNEVDRTLKKNGVELNPLERKAEDARVAAQVASIRKAEAEKQKKNQKPSPTIQRRPQTRKAHPTPKTTTIAQTRTPTAPTTTSKTATSPSILFSASPSSSIPAANATRARTSSPSTSSPIPNTKPTASSKKSSRN